MKRTWKIVGIVTAVAILSLAAGCSNGRQYRQPEFKSVETEEFQLLTDEQYWGGTSKIFKYGDIIAVICYCSELEPTWLHLFSGDGCHLADMVHRGRGPMEVLAPTAAYLRGSMLHIFDIMSHKMVTADLSKIIETGYSAFEEKKMLNDNFYSYVEKLAWGDTLYINIPPLNPKFTARPRLQMVSEDGSVCAQCEETPFQELTAAERFYFENAIMFRSISPDGRHMAMAIGNGAVLETFSLSHDRIRRLSERYYVEPQYDIAKHGVSMNDRTVAGFGYMHSTNDRIYVVYDGLNRYSDKSKLILNKIAVFDWKGNALREIRTNYRISSVYTEDGKVFYAVVEDRDRSMFVARLT